ncbi:MAG TPA: aminotransferase class I/II-fold pyridoxal phosphate-dependent enzyme, partial [Spirochaetia bacterium]|nr:aminotransferase class I/II-fold pyridoxal phosphate-dependent enzyme [Spirochaetia bacterium]
YTSSVGLLPLREKIAEFYDKKYGIQVSPGRIVVTTGTSGAFLAAYSILMDRGNKIALTDPSYPCYKNIAHFLDLVPVLIPIDKSNGYQLTPEKLAEYPDVEAVHIPSPSNPLGSMYRPDNMKALVEYCEARGKTFISDEIYHGLVYEGQEHTALEYGDRVVVINGFSKYFSLTGLRIGWMVLPEPLVRSAEIVLQNISISVSSLCQYGAMAAFDWPYLEKVREIYRERRDFLYGELSRIFTIDARPEGAFYIWADISRYSNDSLSFSDSLLENTHVAVTPGVDFGRNGTHKYIRFSYTRETDHLREGVERLKSYLT